MEVLLQTTKNDQKAPTPEMYQTRKNSEQRFERKGRVGLAAHSGLVHTMTVTATNAHDIPQAANLTHKDDEVVHSNSACQVIQKRPEADRRRPLFRHRLPKIS